MSRMRVARIQRKSRRFPELVFDLCGGRLTVALRMATSTEDAVNPTNMEEQSKDTPKADKAIADQQKDDTTPANVSEQVADDAVKSKDEESALDKPGSDRPPSTIPDLGKSTCNMASISTVHDRCIIMLAKECKSNLLSNIINKPRLLTTGGTVVNLGVGRVFVYLSLMVHIEMFLSIAKL